MVASVTVSGLQSLALISQMLVSVTAPSASLQTGANQLLLKQYTLRETDLRVNSTYSHGLKGQSGC